MLLTPTFTEVSTDPAARSRPVRDAAGVRPGESSDRGTASQPDPSAAGFDMLLHMLASARRRDFFSADVARQVAQANQRAAANQRLTQDDLEFADERIRASSGSSLGDPLSQRHSAVDVRRAELGKGSLAPLYSRSHAEVVRSLGVPVEPAAPLPMQDAGASAAASPRQSSVPSVPFASPAIDPKSIATGGPVAVTPVATVQPATQPTPQPAVASDSAAPAIQAVDGPQRAQAAQARVLTQVTTGVELARPAGVDPPSAADGHQPQGDVGLQAGRDRASAASARHADGRTELPPEQTRATTLNDVLQVLRSNLNQRQAVIKLQLRPPELGHLTVHMETDQNTLRLKIEAESLEVRDLLRGHMSMLADALREQGIEVERYEVVLHDPEAGATTFDQGSGAGATPDGPRDPNREQSGSSAGGEEMDELTLATAVSNAASSSSLDGRLDIRA